MRHGIVSLGIVARERAPRLACSRVDALSSQRRQRARSFVRPSRRRESSDPRRRRIFSDTYIVVAFGSAGCGGAHSPTGTPRSVRRSGGSPRSGGAAVCSPRFPTCARREGPSPRPLGRLRRGGLGEVSVDGLELEVFGALRHSSAPALAPSDRKTTPPNVLAAAPATSKTVTPPAASWDWTGAAEATPPAPEPRAPQLSATACDDDAARAEHNTVRAEAHAHGVHSTVGEVEWAWVNPRFAAAMPVLSVLSAASGPAPQLLRNHQESLRRKGTRHDGQTQT